MQRKLNEQFIKEYSRQFSEKITSEFFAEKEHINGKEILTITPSRQVNYFVLKILFGNWQEEMKKLESPYFNYRHPEVRRAMVDFMNILSQKIQIDEDHFYELVEEAVSDTLKLAVLPQKFLYDELIQKDITNVNEKIIRPLLKYLKLHRSYFEKFFTEHSGEELETFLDQSREFFEGVDVQETVEEELEQLSGILQIRFEKLLETEDSPSEEADDFNSLGPDFSDMEDEEENDDLPADVTEPAEPADGEVFREEEYQEEPEESTEDMEKVVSADYPEVESMEFGEEGSGTVSAFDSELENTFGDDPNRRISEDLSITSGHDEAPVADEELTSEEEDEIRESIESAEGTEEESSEDDTDEDDPADQRNDQDEDDSDQSDSDEEPLNEKFSAENSTINDRYTNEEKFTVADKLEKKRVDDVMEAISVNHRYMFTKELFDGDRDEFNAAISKIEQSGTFDDAVEMLVQDYAKERNWDMNGDEVKELLKVVFRKFR